jgi:hypothetical protein
LDGRELDEGIAIAREIAEAVRPMANVLQITPPIGRAALAVDVLAV